MPIPIPIGGAIIGGLSSLVGGQLGRSATAGQNKASRRFSIERYNAERNDAIAFWKQQNAYNTPQAQMQRFQEAGLNPNLIYGQGTPGNAAQIQTPDTQPAQFRVPDFGDISQTPQINQIADLRIKQAQTDLIKQQEATSYMQQKGLEASTLETIENTGLLLNKKNAQIYTTQLLRSMALYSDDFAAEKLRQLMSGNLGIEISNAQKEAITKNLKVDLGLKRKELELLEQGIPKGSAPYWHILANQSKKMEKSMPKPGSWKTFQ